MPDNLILLLTLTMVDTRSMILAVVIVLSRVDSVVDLWDEMNFLLICVSPTGFIVFPFLGTSSFSACDCGEWQKSFALKLILPTKCYRVSQGVFREWSLKLYLS